MAIPNIFTITNTTLFLLFILSDTLGSFLWQLSQVKGIFIQFKPLVENRFNTEIQNLYSDNGGEFIALRSYLSSHDISHLTASPHTPEHHGLSKRKHHHIVETGLALLSTSNMPLTLWPQAFSTAVFLNNHLTPPVLSNEPPFQKLSRPHRTTPNYVLFGCLYYPWLRPYASIPLFNQTWHLIRRQ